VSLSLRDVTDRLEIADTVTRYSYGLDQRKWEEWDRVFSADAIVDFSFWGIECSTPAELRSLFSADDATRISGQHLLSNQLIWLRGDSAHSYVEFNLTTVARSNRPGIAQRSRGGGPYEDELARTSEGWRIVHRRGTGKWSSHDEIPLK
jgi:hypothetical protein